MATINFRLYGEQIFGLISKYLTEYIKPEIKKEEFISNFKNGFLNLDISDLKKPINILPQLIIKDIKINKIDLNIPDDKTNFILKLSKFKIMLIINELNDKQIEELIIEKRKNLVEKFIKETIDKIEKKDNSSFLKGLINSLIKRALSGLLIELNDINIFLKCNNYMLSLKIDKIIYNENEGIKIDNINLIFSDFKQLKNKTDIIKKFNMRIIINNNSKDNRKSNSIKIQISDLFFEINSNIYICILYIIKKCQEIDKRETFIRYKKLIYFYKPQKNNDKKQYYSQLWFWAIKTVIKLKKYKSQKKLYIFDLLNSIQIKFSNKYINSQKENKDNNDNICDDYIILPEEIILLESTKDKIESKLLENKKGNKLANAFKFFFGDGGDEKNELTEEEKQSLNNSFTRENIINFLNNKKDEDNNNDKEENKKEEQIIDKFKNFFNNISFDITLNKIECLLNCFCSSLSIYFKNINIVLDINKINNSIKYEFIIGDIGYNSKISFFRNIGNENKNHALNIIKKNDIFEIIFRFKNIEINDKILLFIIHFYYSLFYTDKKEENQNIIFVRKNFENKEINNIFSILNKIKINKIPTINIINNNNISIYIDILNYVISNREINFNLNLMDNNLNNILENYELKILKNEENTKFNLEMSNKVEIMLSPQILDFIFMLIWQVILIRQHYNKIFNNSNNLIKRDELLFDFSFEKFINILIKDLEIEIN